MTTKMKCGSCLRVIAIKIDATIAINVNDILFIFNPARHRSENSDSLHAINNTFKIK